MPNSIDWPKTPPPRRRRRFLLLLVALVIVVTGGRAALSYYVDALWFGSLGYGDVFRKTLGFQWAAFTVFAVATFAILYGTFLALKRMHSVDLPSSRTILVGGQAVTFPFGSILRVIALGVSLVIALATGTSMMSEWPTFARYWYAPRIAAGVVDPIFGKPLSFYLFTLPALQLVANWLMTLAVITLAIAAFFLLNAGGSRALEERRNSYNPMPWRGLSLTLAFVLLMLAVQSYVGRFERLLADHTVFSGVTYTDAHVTLTGILVVCLALFAGAVIAIVNAVTVLPRARFLVLAILPAVVCFGALQVCTWYVSSFIVKPNELVREQPYIGFNIGLTRQAYKLDQVSQRQFSAETTVESADAANNQATLQNIRLWDWHALQDTLRQIQEIRTYYDFPDIDIDRYEIDGTIRQVMLAARE